MASISPAIKASDHTGAVSLWLDAFRWIAALLVLFTHANNRFFVKPLSLQAHERSIPHYAFAMLGGFGHQAVVVFFVLSGMFVGGSSLRAWERSGRVDSAGYVSKRLTRLWVVLIPSFFVTYLLDRAGLGLLAPNQAMPYLPYEHRGVSTLLCNAAFLQTAFCNQYGSNGALWSLFSEFWYYVAWLLVLAGLWMFKSRPWMRGLWLLVPAALLVALASFQFVGPNVAAYSLIWLSGVAASRLTRPFVDVGVGVMAGVLLGYLFLVRLLVPTAWADETFGVWFVCDSGLALLFTNLILAMKATRTLAPPPGRHFHTGAAGFAFSLYCTHTPVLNVYIAAATFTLGTGYQMVPKGVLPWAILSGGLATAIAFAFLFSRLTEARTDKVREILERRIDFLYPAFRLSSPR